MTSDMDITISSLSSSELSENAEPSFNLDPDDDDDDGDTVSVHTANGSRLVLRIRDIIRMTSDAILAWSFPGSPRSNATEDDDSESNSNSNASVGGGVWITSERTWD